jgi:hypothetical protein
MSKIVDISWDGHAITVTSTHVVPLEPIVLKGDIFAWARARGFTDIYPAGGGMAFGFRRYTADKSTKVIEGWYKIDLVDMHIISPIVDIKKFMQVWVHAHAIPEDDFHRFPRKDVRIEGVI